ncbi:D-alanyl-D-alanine dipeptidase [Laspinema sp. A4]|uniref:M15 family metallopeptidase n=1 Tax=Laspinema sp. D2d TaxID=2953686 RepID=UPI0021BB2E1B|nr:M15 family metallopeptidase [Laspinema sp. D2d]MCT7984310.1 D-alanyl-D-alanine dipeptidase [Laspinema sp. D2d]
MKPYQHIPILDCGEPLVAIPGEQFALVLPHPYELLGAPYAGRSPFYLREGVLRGLIQAQTYLQEQYPQWQILIFDAYRPIAVQQFMVDYTFMEQVRSQGLDSENLSPSERQEILAQVYQFWAIPSLDPATPPPHATGAAVDVTLVNEAGIAVEMGSPIDEISPRSHPDYFAQSSDRPHQDYHNHRQILAQAMQQAGFAQHPNEWWHFCKGDQMWAWLTHQETAFYGRVE